MSKKSITFISVARSDFGRLYPTINAVNNDSSFDLNLIVTGNHNSEKFGSSIEEILSHGIEINHQINLKSGDMAGRSAEISTGLNKWFKANGTDFFVILGDRYEMLAAAQSAFFNNVPIIHIGGGYQTSGAIDDQVRHAISVLSTYHFTATEKCRKRVIEIINHDQGVFLSGAPDLEILKNIETLSKDSFYEKCGLKENKPFVLVTVHPETLLSLEENEENLGELRLFLEEIEEQILITAPCADPGAEKVFEMIEELKKSRGDVIYIKSLGMEKYATAMKFAELMIGNSSSGIIESASMGIPVLNVGERQGGREINTNVLNSRFRKINLHRRYDALKCPDFKRMCMDIDNIYGDGRFSKSFVKFLNIL